MLAIPPEQEVRFDRFSDSAGSYVTLDSNNPAIYKQLYRAAKAKLKLRLKATVERKPVKEEISNKTTMDQKKSVASSFESRNTFLETVLSQPADKAAAPSFKSFQKTCQFSPKCTIPGAFDTEANNPEPSAKAAPLFPPFKDVYSVPTIPTMSDFPSTSYTIDCNHCGSSVPNEHYHCGICEGGDFDLCKTCIDAGVTCDGEEHWLLKRSIRNGIVVPSTTETLPPKKLSKASSNVQEEVVTPVSPEHDGDGLTCNSCICRKYINITPNPSANRRPEFPAREFVTCQQCSDYDLCFNCFQDDEHGHDPVHTFESRDPEALEDCDTVKAMCGAGRGVRHDAICDGCDEVSLQLPTSRTFADL